MYFAAYAGERKNKKKAVTSSADKQFRSLNSRFKLHVISVQCNFYNITFYIVHS